MFFIVLISVLLLYCSQGLAVQKCDLNDCVPGPFCAAAIKRLTATYESKNSEKIAKLWEFFSSIQCGNTDNAPYITKICCSQVSLLDQDSLLQSINQHQNLRLLPKTCGGLMQNRISDPVEQNYPWLALILYENGFGCSGSVINERYVLTAAHCLKDKEIQRVRLGEYDIRRSERCLNVEIHGCDFQTEDILVEETITHEGFQGHLYDVNDIALIRLKKPADFSQSNIAPICLPKTWDLRQQNMTGTRAKVSDWKLGQPYYTYSWEELPIITDCMINTGKISCDPNSLCIGDLGSPLMVESRYNDKSSYVQYGIVSDGIQNCNEDKPRAYTDVTKHMKWILDKMKP